MDAEGSLMVRIARISLVVCILVSVSLIGGETFAASTDDLKKIVTFKNIDLKTLLGYTTALGVVTTSRSSIVHNLSFINALAIALPVDDITGALASLLSSVYVLEVADDLLTLVDPICPTTAPPSIESYPWGQQQINVPAVHRAPLSVQGSGVTVAVLDTGIDSTHLGNPLGEFYQSRNTGGYNALPGGGPYFDGHGHGTHMAGIIAAALNGRGVIGAAPKAQLAAVKVLDDNGIGHSSDVINGLQWVHDNGIRVVNMSFGFASPSTPLRQAIQLLGNTGIIMVASAGNHCAAATASEEGGDDCGPAATCDAPLTAVTYPAAYPAVIAVAATDIHEHITEYSLSGTEVEIAAPGGAQTSGQILSTNTTKEGGYGVGYGTSQAAAHVTGAIALALQLRPSLSIAQLRNVLRATAVKLYDENSDEYSKERQGEGLIDTKAMIGALP
jgi:subtilisin family serine protease